MAKIVPKAKPQTSWLVPVKALWSMTSIIADMMYHSRVNGWWVLGSA
jgi:hypothetical protein